MATAPIDSSIRRAVLESISPGNIVPDSRQSLDDNPIVIMEPGDADISMYFLDGLGLIGSYGNAYQGYSGSTFVVTINPPQTINLLDDLENDGNPNIDGKVPVYVESEGQYVPTQILTGSTTFIIEKPTNRPYTIALAAQFRVQILGGTHTIDAGPASIDYNTGVKEIGDPVVINVSGTTGASSYLTIQVNWKRLADATP